MVTRRLLSDTVQNVPLACTPNIPNKAISTPPNPIFRTLIAGFESGKVLNSLLGSELLDYHPPVNIDLQTHNLQIHSAVDSNCYLICSGRVRLLHQNHDIHRHISATVLKAGDLFGTDHLFYDRPLPYQAIASSPCQVIQMPYAQVAQLFEAHPFLTTYLRQKMQEREQLIFFKSFTHLRSHPSETLKQSLLPLLTEQTVAAGTPLSQIVGDRPAQVWLRSGQILNPANPTAVPRIGDSWEDASPSVRDWVAQTDLVLYKLLLSY